MDDKEKELYDIGRVDCLKERYKMNNQINNLNDKVKDHEMFFVKIDEIKTKINLINNIETKIDSFIKNIEETNKKTEIKFDKIDGEINNNKLKMAEIETIKKIERFILGSLLVPVITGIIWILLKISEHGEKLTHIK